MKNRRLESLTMLSTLLVANIFILLWMQGQPFATVWANGLASSANAPVAAAPIPRTFSYQGTLRDANGDLISGTVDLTLKLYSAVTGGSALYSESFTNINVRTGLFSIVVGDTTPIDPAVFDNFPLYLGLSVNQDAEMLPRLRLHPVPYALQASSAETALTADNLTAGGGVPNLITLGTAGVSEIGFAPNGGKITSTASGLALSGGTNAAVSTAGDLSVGGNLTVAGDWNAGATHHIGDSNGGANKQETYPVSINRYVIEAPDNGTSPNTVPLDDDLINELCQDVDGCQVSLYMRDWDDANARGLLAGSGPFRMSLSAADNSGRQQWSIYEPQGTGTLGVDNDGSVAHLMNVFGSCLFTDGEHNNAQGSDGEPGFHLLNWFGSFNGAFDSTDMTCVLIIED